MDSAYTANHLIGGHIQVDLDHFLAVVDHQAEFGITLIGTNGSNFHRHLQMELLAGKALYIGIQGRCLLCIHNQIRIVALIGFHIQHITAMIIAGAAEESAVGVNLNITAIVLIFLFFFRQAKSCQNAHIFSGHLEG